MCGRYNNHLPKMHGWSAALKEWPTIEPSYNVTPTATVASFRTRRGEAMRWGMVPSWSKSFDSKFATFNARIETVDKKPTFREAWQQSQRCMIPMAGYYEWTGDKNNKKPFYISDRDNGCLMVAGLYETWGDNQLSCTILTAPANEGLHHIHHRMPIMLTPAGIKDWIYGENDKESILALEQPNVIYHPVSKAVGNVRNNDETLIRPLV
jgi:putative SOS response-associated peptidase YedK